MMPRWSREFEEPIIIPPRGPRGKSRELVTLKDAGEYIAQGRAHGNGVANCNGSVASAVRGAPTMLARIGIMKALHRHEVREFKPSEKKTHWGKRKLARDR
jgi:hypothetical protein